MKSDDDLYKSQWKNLSYEEKVRKYEIHARNKRALGIDPEILAGWSPEARVFILEMRANKKTLVYDEDTMQFVEVASGV